MALSRRSSRTGRSRFTLLLLVLTSVTVLTLDFRGSGVVDDLRGGAATAFGPVRDAASWVGAPVADAWNGVFGYGDLEAENERLRERLAEVEGRRARGDDALRQMEERDRLDDIWRWTDAPTVVARVVGGSLSNFQHTVEIDKGSDHGLAEGMTVVTGAGLVGELRQVTATRSVVRLITDPGFEIGVRLVRSREIGIAHGTGSDDAIVVEGSVPLSVDVNEREAVTTCGCERSRFPPDIPIGRVTTITRAPDQLSQVIEVGLLADIERLTYVRVLQWEGG